MLGGILTGLLISPDPVIVIVCGVAALLPDLDHPQSLISRRVGLLGAPIHLVVSHRGVLHSGLFVLLLMLSALYVPDSYRLYAVAAVAAYASHLALDALTVSGIPLLWPSGERFRLLKWRTGGVGEAYTAVALVAAIAVRIYLI